MIKAVRRNAPGDNHTVGDARGRKVAQNGHAVPIAQLEIEHDDINGSRACEFKPFGTGLGDEHIEPRLRQDEDAVLEDLRRSLNLRT